MQFVYHSVSNACVLQEKTGGGERKKKIRTNLKLKKTHLNPKKVRKKKEKKISPFAKPASAFNRRFNCKQKHNVIVKYNLKECICFPIVYIVKHPNKEIKKAII